MVVGLLQSCCSLHAITPVLCLLGANEALAWTGSEDGPNALLCCIHNRHEWFSGVLCIVFTHAHYDTTANPEKISQWMYVFG